MELADKREQERQLGDNTPLKSAGVADQLRAGPHLNVKRYPGQPFFSRYRITSKLPQAAAPFMSSLALPLIVFTPSRKMRRHSLEWRGAL